MPKLRRLSGHEVIAILKSFGFLVVAQRGSHFFTPEQRQRYSSVRAYDTTPKAPIP